MIEEPFYQPASFFHEKNITIGAGRILYAQSAVSTNGEAHAEGWVLPGGQRTQDEQYAYLAAGVLDQLARAGGA